MEQVRKSRLFQFSNFSIVRWHWKMLAPQEKVEMTPLVECSKGRAQKWRSFVAHLLLFLFSTQEDHLAPSCEDERGLEQLISVQASPAVAEIIISQVHLAYNYLGLFGIFYGTYDMAWHNNCVKTTHIYIFFKIFTPVCQFLILRIRFVGY